MHDVHSLGSLLAARRIVSRLDLAFAERLLVCAGLKDISNNYVKAWSPIQFQFNNNTTARSEIAWTKNFGAGLITITYLTL